MSSAKELGFTSVTTTPLPEGTFKLSCNFRREVVDRNAQLTLLRLRFVTLFAVL